MSLPRKVMKVYDEIGMREENWPKGAVRIEKNKDPRSRIPFIFYNEHNEPMCSSKRADWTPEEPKYCSITTFLLPNGRCKKHGGVTGPTGVAHHNFKNGRYTNNLASHLAARYEDGRTDPEIHSLNDEIALMTMKIGHLLESASEGGAHEAFKELQQGWKAFLYANKDGDQDKMRDAMRRVSDAMAKGSSEALVWEQIGKLVDSRRKLVLAESKRMQMLDQYISVEQMNVMIAMLLTIVDRRITDREAVGLIVQDFGKITGRRVPENKALSPAPVEGELVGEEE